MRSTILSPKILCAPFSDSKSSGPKTIIRIVSTIICFFSASSILCAATFYLDATNGSDTASGSSAAPWKTFAKAQASVASGDTVLMRSGSYGNFSQTKMYSNFVTYKADVGATPLVGNISLGSGSGYLRFDGLDVSGWANLYGGDHVELLNSKVHYPGDRYAAPANLVDIRYTKYGLVKGCDISHGKTGIKIDNAASPTVSGNALHDLAVDVMTATPSTNFVCEYNHAYNIHQDRIKVKDYYSAIPFVAASSSITVTDKIYSDLIIKVPAGFTGIAAYANFPTTLSFANLNGFSCTQTGSPGSSVVLRMSSAVNGATSGTYAESPVSGVALADFKSLTSVKSVAIVVKSSTSAFTLDISDCQGSNGAHQDFVVLSGSNATIRGNVFHDGCNQGIFTSPANITGILVENNLIYDMEGFNFTNLSITGSGIIRNNTFMGYMRGTGYENPLNKYHLNGIAQIIANDSGSGIQVYNNIVGGELSSAGSYNDWNIVTRQITAGSHTLVISGTNAAGVNFDSGFFDSVNFTRYHGKLLNHLLASGSKGINFGVITGQSTASCGTVDTPTGFVNLNGTPRDASHHSAGAHEYPQSGGATANQPPVFNALADQTGAVNAPLTFTVSASDPEGAAVTLSAQNLPTGATFSDGTFTWTPTAAGSYSVTFTASDGIMTATKTVAITVTDATTTNTPPVLAAIGNKTVAANTLLTFNLSATDADGDAITYSASGMPSGAALTGASFSWLPTLSNVGTYTVTFSASDGKASVSQPVTITVTSSPTTTTGPVGYWKLDETSGTTAADSSGNANTASLVSGPVWSTGGVSGGALKFSGTTPAARLSMSKMNAGQGTVAIWIRPASFTATPNYIFGHSLADWSSRIQLYTNGTTGSLALGLGDSHARVTGIATLAVNTWYHIALTWNGTSYAVYVNGIQKAAGAYTGLASLASAADIGNDGTDTHSESFNGMLDEARIYNRALTATEVTSLYSSVTPSTTSLAPVFDPIANQTVAEREVCSFTVSARAPNGASVVLAAQNVPQYASYSAGNFYWRPTYDQQGTYSVTFTATANGITTAKIVQITVTNVNRPPVLYSIASQTVTAGTKLTFTAKANDPDTTDTLTYSATGLPSGATFTSAGVFTWTPTTSQKGTRSVTIKVSDGYASDSQAVSITVK